MTIVIAVVALLVLVVVVVASRRARRPTDGVAQFRRQIDALSPESRRPVVDQVHHLDHDSRRERGPTHGS